MDTTLTIILLALAGVILFFYLRRRNARLRRED
jgi:LPXTG-motif cell wall-anchored protein